MPPMTTILRLEAQTNLCALSSGSTDTEDHGQWTQILDQGCAPEYFCVCPMSHLNNNIVFNDNR